MACSTLCGFPSGTSGKSFQSNHKRRKQQKKDAPEDAGYTPTRAGMKTRLALIVLGLVILPTAVLSLMASAVLRDWEQVLRRRLEITAANAIHEASSQVRARLEDNMERVRFAVAETLGRGVNLQELPAVAGRLQNASPLVDQVYLYMSPVGFVYPEGGGRGRRSEAESQKVEGSRKNAPAGAAENPDRRLAERVHQEVARASGRTDTICFVFDDAIYCFSFLRNRQGLYAGFRVSAEGFDRMLNHVMSLLSAGGFVLSAAAPGGGTADVVVTDSFSPPSGPATLPAAGARPDVRPPPRGSDVLVKGRLDPPFGFVEVTAFLDETDAPERGTGLRGRLYGWGILLAAGVVAIGGWLIFREAAAEIRRARERDDFVMSVSHDLRTPVSSMKMLAESLYLGHVRDADRQRRFLGTIVREADWLADTVERLLFFVRQEHDAVVFSMELLDIGLLARSAVDTFADRLGMAVRPAGDCGRPAGDPERGIIESAIPSDLPRVKGDWEALVKVLFNLLDNAVKYGVRKAEGGGREENVECRREEDSLQKATKRGDVEGADEDGARRSTFHVPPSTSHGQLPGVGQLIEVRVAPARARGREWVTLAVRDRGIGIADKDRKKIFRKFYRVNSAQRREIPGVGLGLALCRDIVRAHGGRIEVESRLGEGSVFTVWLPAAEA